MASIDERVVGLRFDGSKFQSGIKPTIDGLDQLKSSLKMEGATKALDDLDTAGKRFSLASVGQAAEGVGLKFVALATIGITALSNIVNKAVDAGERIIKSLTIDPIKAGFDEYELKMGSIQTILANTARYGTSLEEVTGNLDALNDYADKTIYNFGDMTKNIGLFTNAGLRIEEATSLIKGFSNESAASGVSAQGAAGAAYQLSQALSAGQIRLMDWRSLTNVGLGNKNMQRGILDIALAMGTLEGKSITAADIQRDFNGSLEKGWLTADVMSNYLKIMSGDMDAATQASLGLSDAQISAFAKQQNTAEEAATKVRTYTQLLSTLRESVGSGWSQTFDILLGDFEEATELFTNINNTLGGMIGAVSEARNNLLQDWADAGGRTALIDTLAKAFGLLMDIMRPVTLAFQDIFPPVTGEMLFNITKRVQDFIESLQITANVTNDLRQTFKGVFAIFSIVWSVVKAAAGAFGELFGVAAGGAGSILGVTASIGRFFVKVDEAIKSGTGLTRFFDGLVAVLKVPLNLFKTLIGFIGVIIEEVGKLDMFQFDNVAGRLNDRMESLSKTGEFVANVFAGFGDVLKSVWNFFGPFAETVGKFFAGLGGAIADSFQNGNFNTLLDFLNTGLFATVVVMISKFVKSIKGTLDSLGSGGGLIDTIKGVFGELSGTLQAMQGQLKAKTLLMIAGAVGILTLSVIALSMIDSAKLFIALGAITVMFTQLGLVMYAFDRMFAITSGAKMAILAAAMIGMATAMVIFAGAVAILGAMDAESLTRGLIGLAGAMGIMTLAMLIMSKAGPGAILGSIGIAIASGGILILAGALKVLATLSWDDIGRGLTALGGALGILALGLTLMSGSIVGAIALTTASVGILVIAAALKVFSTLSWDDIGRAMVLLAGTLAILALGLTLMSGAIPGAIAMVIVAGSLVVLGGALKIFSTLDWEGIARAMVLLGGTMAILAIGLNLMSGAIPGAIALMFAAGALAVIAGVLVVLGGMSWEQIGTGLGALALGLGLIALAGYALTPALPGLLGLGAAMLLFGLGALAAGVGMTAISIALTAFSIAGGAAITFLVAAVSALAGLIPFVAKQIGLGLIAIAEVIGDSGPQILEAISAILQALIQALIEVIPPLIEAAVLLITELVAALIVLIPLLVDAGMKLVIGILDGIAKNIGQVVEKGVDLIVALLDGIGKAIPRLLIAGADLVIDFLNGIATTIREKSSEFQDAGINIANAIIEGMTGGITKGITTVINSVKNMATNALNAAKKALGIASPSKEFKEVGKFSTEGLANGLTAFSSISEKAAGNLGKNTLKSLKKSMANAGDFMRFGGMDTQPTVRPVLDLTAIKRDAGLIGTIIGGQSLSVEGPTARVTAVSADYEDYQEAMAEANGPKTEVNMTQNNYSPKALPASEIYRQSKNQMSILKGELESA